MSSNFSIIKIYLSFDVIKTNNKQSPRNNLFEKRKCKDLLGNKRGGLASITLIPYPDLEPKTTLYFLPPKRAFGFKGLREEE